MYYSEVKKYAPQYGQARNSRVPSEEHQERASAVAASGHTRRPLCNHSISRTKIFSQIKNYSTSHGVRAARPGQGPQAQKRPGIFIPPVILDISPESSV